VNVEKFEPITVKNRKNTENKAIFGTTAKKTVDERGDPS
jgi:hypothetical protein